jgi:hypothetical protein
LASIRHFRAELRLKIDALESDLDWLACRVARGAASSEQLVRAHVERLSRQLARQRPAHPTAPSTLTGWVAGARSRACAAMDVASAAIDEAARAALEAWLAEKQAARTSQQQGGEPDTKHAPADRVRLRVCP